MCCMRAFSTAVSGHMQPLPPNSTVPSTSSITPSAFDGEPLGQVVHLGVELEHQAGAFVLGFGAFEDQIAHLRDRSGGAIFRHT